MSRMPRLLPIVAVAIVGVLAINLVRGGPQLLGAAKAFAEDVGGKSKPAAPPTPDAAILAAKPVAPVCAPTASELAKEAGLSPAELQVLQSLGSRRGELDQRETDLDTQVQLIAAAEAKLDGRIKEMGGLKDEVQGLLGQADQQQEAETARLITIYEKMDKKSAAARIALMDDSVRLPIAAKMKPAKLADILASMAPEEAKSLTEKLAKRVSGAAAITNAKAALNPPAAQAAATPPPAPAPSKAVAAQDSKTPPPAASQPAMAADVAPKPAKPHHAAQKAKPKAVAKPKPKPADAAEAAGDTRSNKPKPPAGAPTQAQGAAATPAVPAATPPPKPS